jgi:hypothetical protein
MVEVSNRLENRTKHRARIASTNSDERFVGILNCIKLTREQSLKVHH